MTNADAGSQSTPERVSEPSTSTPEGKYGRPLTGSDWVGLPLRVGHFPAGGATQDLHAQEDAILLWSGGASNVTIDGRGPEEQAVKRRAFSRLSGMIDLLPEGTWFERIEWSGEETTCTAVNMPRSCLAELTHDSPSGLDPSLGPEFCLVDAHVVDLARRLQREAEGKESLGAVYVQSLSLALACYVSARYGRAKAAERAAAPFTERQRRVLVEFVEENLSLNFGLVDLAGLVGYSPDHFSRLFKQGFEQSPHQYVLSRRIERAQAMLHDDSLSISHIAGACGFSSQAHLGAMFKRHVGVTPGAYRRR